MKSRSRTILLLDPPARRPILRDYYCSSRPKVPYRWQPVDLLALSARLGPRARVFLVDAQAKGLSAARARALVRAQKPDQIFALVSRLTCEEDLAFLKSVATPSVRISIGGEAALWPAFPFDRHPFIHGAILDFSAPEAAEYLLGAKPDGRIRTARHAPDPPPLNGRFSLGIPAHESLPQRGYRLPGWRGAFASVLTDFGCPFSCSFCNSGAGCLGYKERCLSDLERELDHLHRQGAAKIYLRDMTFAANPGRAPELCDLFARYRFELRGYLRPDRVDAELARRLARAGMTLAQLGVEAAGPDERAALGKSISNPHLHRTVSLLREHGIHTGLHFMVGVADQPIAAANACARLAAELDAAYCSINVYEPRHGVPALPRPSRAMVHAHRLAALTAMAGFHLRPRFLWTSRKTRAYRVQRSATDEAVEQGT